MCRRLICLVSFVLVLGLVGSASAAVLYSDSFDRPDSYTVGTNDNALGGIVSAPWVEVEGAETQHQIRGNALVMTAGAGNSYIGHKFTGAELLTTFTIEFDVMPSARVSGAWFAIEFAPAESFTTSIDLTQSRVTLALLMRPQSNFVVWDNGANVGTNSRNLIDNSSDPARIRLQIDSPDGYSDGDTATIRMWINDVLVENFGGGSSYEFTWQGHTDGLYISFENQNPLDKTVDNLVIYSPFSPTKAFDPSPANEATDVRRDAILGWTAGQSAKTHDVYLGTVFDDVADASRTDPRGALVSQGRPENTYDRPDLLELGQTYYWRVDEVNAPPDNTIFKGDVWSFTVEPFAYVVENITATASSSDVDKGPENTVNGSGLDGSGLLHGNMGVDSMWLSDPIGAQPTWIGFQFDKVYKLHQMWVWNYNETWEPMIGAGFKDVTVEYSVDGADYTTLGTTHEFDQGPGLPDYAHNTTIDFRGVPAKYVRLIANSNWGGGMLPQYGLSEVRFLYIPVLAREPYPADGATNVSTGTIDEPIDVTVSFRGGREAARHEVYIDDNWRAVAKGTAPVATVTETSYGPLSLDLGQTYYWRIDEVNDVETPNVWEGDVWSFATQGYFVVDDFETYDANENQIWYIWRDGLGFGAVDSPPFSPGNGTGSAVGDETTGSYTEETIFHEGGHSVPYAYNNSGSTGKLNYSEAAMTLTSGRDWTRRGVKALTLWFRGYPASVGSFTEAPAGTYTMTVRSTNIGGTSDQFHFAYQQFSGAGSIIAKIDRLQRTNDTARAGVMIRDTLDPDSAHAAVLLQPRNGGSFMRRALTAGASTPTADAAMSAPLWVKVERDMGGMVTGSYSTDGVTWTDLGGELITMNTPMYVGLAVASNHATRTCEAIFSNVQITGASGQWMNQDVGILANDPERMYVAVANSGGTPAVVYYDDPDDPDAIPTQTGAWTEWNIDLQAFTDQGVNLADVDSISIGFGDKSNPQPGGKGHMFFDDIRLYPARCMPSLLKPAADLNNDCVVDYLDVETAAADWLKSDSLVATVAPDPAALVAHYKLDGNANDSSGNNNHGAEKGGPTYVAGIFDQALSFDGFDDYVALDANYAGTGHTEVSVCAWIRTSSSAGQHFVSFDRDEYWRLGLGDQVPAGHLGWHVMTMVGRTETQVDYGSVGRVDDGQWHHVAGTFNNGTLIMYIDGNPEPPVTGGPTFGTGLVRWGFLGIGSESEDMYNGMTNAAGYTDGDLDEVRIYERALSEAEIRYLADDTPGDGELYIAVPSIANIYNEESPRARSVNFKDYALIADQWLDEQLWP